jgi:ATP-binding protein involved in chromosome partitioning
MMYSVTEILDALRHVEDPDFKKDLVTLNMIRDIELDGNKVSFTLVLTTPACPIKDLLKNNCIEAIKTRVSADLEVNITITSEVTSIRNSEINILPSVKNIICIASGKGGVGKSTMSVNLAYALAATGASVGLIDADIHGPSIPIMMGLKHVKPQVREIKGKHYMIPIEKDGIKVLSIGFMVDERQAVVWRGPMVTSALRQFITDVIWGKLDYLLIDMPPGTGDVHLSITQTVPLTGVIIVTTPQQVAVADARKAIAMYRLPEMNVPILGLVENMAWFSPAELPDNKYFIFGKGGGKQLADSYEIPFLGEVPLIQAIMEGAESGEPAAGSNNEEISQFYQRIAENAAQQIAIKNAARMEPSQFA